MSIKVTEERDLVLLALDVDGGHPVGVLRHLRGALLSAAAHGAGSGFAHACDEAEFVCCDDFGEEFLVGQSLGCLAFEDDLDGMASLCKVLGVPDGVHDGAPAVVEYYEKQLSAHYLL